MKKDNNLYEKLINEVNVISKKQENKNNRDYKEKGLAFNIFEILNIERNEIRICKVMSELLNPNGIHYQGNKYLLAFAQVIPQLKYTFSKMSSEELNSLHVYVEDTISDKRRVDITIRGINTFIPIEVKIDAGDQYNQCKDYLEFARKYYSNGEERLYYLTLDGRLPSEKSLKNLQPIYYDLSEETESNNEKTIIGYEGIVCISFKSHISRWIKRCIDETGKELLPIHEILKQLEMTILKITGGIEQVEKKEICSLIGKNEENIKAVSDMIVAYEDVSLKCIESVFDAILSFAEIHDSAKNIKLNSFHYKETDLIETNHSYIYYYSKTKVFPGKSFYLCDYDSDRELWVRVEIDTYLFIGICVVPAKIEDAPNFWENSLTTIEEDNLICETFPKNMKKKNTKNTWWIAWEYIGYTGEDGKEFDKVNFKDRDNSFIGLFNSNNFKKFSSNINEKVKDYLMLSKEIKSK